MAVACMGASRKLTRPLFYFKHSHVAKFSQTGIFGHIQRTVTDVIPQMQQGEELTNFRAVSCDFSVCGR